MKGIPAVIGIEVFNIISNDFPVFLPEFDTVGLRIGDEEPAIRKRVRGRIDLMLKRKRSGIQERRDDFVVIIGDAFL